MLYMEEKTNYCRDEAFSEDKQGEGCREGFKGPQKEERVTTKRKEERLKVKSKVDLYM